MQRIPLVLLATLAWFIPLAQQVETPANAPADRAPDAIRASLPLLQQSADTWLSKRDCSSCHHQGLGTMTVLLARERGFEIDEAMLAEQIERLRPTESGNRDSVMQGDAGINAQTGQAYRLLALAAANVPPDPEIDARVFFLAAKQGSDGRWRSISHRPPLEDSAVTATAFAARAIQLYAPPGRAAQIAGQVERARAWIAGAKPRSNEERTMQLFGLWWTGGTDAQLAAARDALLAEQRTDGGWAQIATRASDAYATGQALVALHRAGGIAVTSPAYVRGVEFLLRTQHEDGSWLVETRRKTDGLPYFETGFPYGQHQFLSYAATCWATMALLSTLEPGPSPVFSRAAVERSSSERPLAQDDGVTPLMEAVAFEDLDRVRALLESGADVGLASKRGLTAPMCAAGDVAKARLLVEHGAEVEARSQLGVTAAMLAASSFGGRDVLALLLEHGANASARAEDETTVLMCAALGGDRGSIDLVLDHGAKIDEADASGITALDVATYQGDAETVRHLLEHGASVDPKSTDGDSSPLINSVIDGSSEVVAVLLAKGAKLDARDGEGFTPLMWAATVDWGDSTVLEALLEKGADVNARTESGVTALARAEQNGNARFAELLREAGAEE